MGGKKFGPGVSITKAISPRAFSAATGGPAQAKKYMRPQVDPGADSEASARSAEQRAKAAEKLANDKTESLARQESAKKRSAFRRRSANRRSLMDDNSNRSSSMG